VSALGAWLAAAATTAVTTPLAARAARALGFLDRPAAAPERKLQRVAVPPVGGLALLCGLAAARLAGLVPFSTWSVLGAPGELRGGGPGGQTFRSLL
jgi:UDP-N-acetylmuramyl pentapeptide phosphotransferase/UDP-N-acetylglucosamine-1-phosphate transferase